MGIKIWERYFIKEFLKIFFLFLTCFYAIYVIIDYASHTGALASHHIHIKGVELFRYYFYVFASQAEILIPFALIIATIKTLCNFNTNQELVALMASGVKRKTLMRPFIFIALLLVFALYLNEQFLLPPALKRLHRIEDSTKHTRSHNHLNLAAKTLILDDGSLLVFQSYDSSTEQFFDVYWIASLDHVYRIKYLSPASPPTGYFVDELMRQENGDLTFKESFQELKFETMRFNSETLQSTLVDSDLLSLGELWEKIPKHFNEDLSEKESKLLASFHWKLAIPWLSLLAVLAPAPFCMRFSRQLPVFFIYVCGIFGLLAFYLVLDAADIVAKRQVVKPFFALWIPFLTISTFFVWRFVKKI